MTWMWAGLALLVLVRLLVLAHRAERRRELERCLEAAEAGVRDLEGAAQPNPKGGPI